MLSMGELGGVGVEYGASILVGGRGRVKEGRQSKNNKEGMARQ